MSKSELPEHPSLEFLKRRAKERLADLRAHEPRTKLADAQLAIARDYGYASWRALKAEVDRRRAPALAAFFAACEAGDVATLEPMLAREPALVRERTAGGATPLHAAIHHAAAVRLLLDRGADPDARDTGDHATPLHGARELDVMRMLLDAGADVHGTGDAHRLDVIGWHTCFDRTLDREGLALLLARGARHHIFSAIAAGDRDAIEALVEKDPAALARRLAKTEGGQTALHYVIAPPDGLVGGGFRTGDHYATLELLIDLGADLEARDDRGRTPLDIATLRGDHEAMSRLQAAGAQVPAAAEASDFDTAMAGLASTITRADAMLRVPDVRATVDWYCSIGFRLAGSYSIDTDEAWAGLALGSCHLMLVPGGVRGAPRETSLWFRTERVDELYELLKRRQLSGTQPETPFVQDLYDTFYGQREFCIVDPNGYHLTFCRSIR
jgi:ankyrin repeat protein